MELQCQSSHSYKISQAHFVAKDNISLNTGQEQCDHSCKQFKAIKMLQRLDECQPCPFSSLEPRSFWPVAGIESSGRTPFSEHVQSIPFIFSANQICQIWREVRESRTSGVGQSHSSRSLPQVRRTVALGTRMNLAKKDVPHSQSITLEKTKFSFFYIPKLSGHHSSQKLTSLEPKKMRVQYCRKWTL